MSSEISRDFFPSLDATQQSPSATATPAATPARRRLPNPQTRARGIVRLLIDGRDLEFSLSRLGIRIRTMGKSKPKLDRVFNFTELKSATDGQFLLTYETRTTTVENSPQSPEGQSAPPQ